MVCAVVCVAVAAVQAALPTFWQVSTEAEFLEGDVESVSIDVYGRLTLGPATAPLYESSAPFLWTLASAPDGSVFVGSGNEGQVYRVDTDGRGAIFFDFRRTRSPRDRAGARGRHLCRDLAGRHDLQSR